MPCGKSIYEENKLEGYSAIVNNNLLSVVEL